MPYGNYLFYLLPSDIFIKCPTPLGTQTMVDGNMCDVACYKYLAARPVPRRTEPQARYRAGPNTQSTKRNVMAGGRGVPGYDPRYFAHTLPQAQFQARNSKDNEDSHLTFCTNFRHFASVDRRHAAARRMYRQTYPGHLQFARAQNRLRTRSKNDPRSNIKKCLFPPMRHFARFFVGLLNPSS